VNTKTRKQNALVIYARIHRDNKKIQNSLFVNIKVIIILPHILHNTNENAATVTSNGRGKA